MEPARTILHVDMDAFFAAVEQRDNPALRGKPVLVGGRGKRGVVTTASYEARPFGCRSAMPMGKALRLCPHAIVVPGRMGVYVEVSKAVGEICRRFTPDVQPISIDEAFLDVTGSRRLLGDGMTIGAALRKAIKDELHLTASVGVAPNKFLAKVASDTCKPDGLREITAESAAATLAPMPASVIFGIGPKAASRLAAIGVKTCADLRAMGSARLEREFGEAGGEWFRLAHGEDQRVVHTDHEAKSIGKERTFGDDISDPAQLRAVLLGEVESASRSLREDGLVCRRVTVKLRTPEFRTFTRATTLPGATDRTEDLAEAAREILDEWLDTRPGPLRLLGVSLGRLSVRTEPPQPLLFDQAAPSQKRSRIDAAADAIVQRFGHGAIARAGATPAREITMTRNAPKRNQIEEEES